MKQKRKVKSLLPKKNFVNGRFLTILLVVLSLVLCVGGVSLLTHSVLAQVAGGPAGLIGGQEVQVTVNHIMPKLEHASTCEINNEYVTGTTIQTGIRGSTIILEPIIAHEYYTGQQRSYTISSTVNSDNVTGIFYELLGVNYGGPKDQNGNKIPDGWEKRLTITIHYMYTGGRGKVADSTVITGVLNNTSYDTQGHFTFPIVSWYYPDKSRIRRTKYDIACNDSIEATVRYSPNNDENGNGYADEEENIVTINYECKTSKEKPYDCNIPSMTGLYVSGSDIKCMDFGKQLSQYIPSGYTWDYDCSKQQCNFRSIEKNQEESCSIKLSPIKDQNNDGIWDGAQELWEITEFDYTGLDNKVEVLYGMRFLDPSDFMKIVNSIYMSGSSLYISPNPVVVNGNTVDTGVYSHILGGKNNEVYSDNITLIAGSNNKIHAGNDNASVLGGNGNEVMPGKSGGIPTILVGGELNVMGTGHDGNALIGGKRNNIEEGHSNVFILGGENNKILGKDEEGFPISSNNAIVGGKNVNLVGIDNIFVYSNIDDGFSPTSHKAFYLNVENGAGINTGGIEGLSVGGAVSIGEVDINNNRCKGDNLGVVGSYEGCLVGCTDAGFKARWKWEMLDQGNECAEICENNSGHCLNQDVEVVNVEDYDAQCTTGVVNTGNAHLCIDDLDSYKNVIFESSLIDSDEECPTGQNICVYQCNEGYHLTGDSEGIGCYSDCKLPWDETETIKHNETVFGYNIENVSCSNDVYVFPLETEIINKGQPGPTYAKGDITRNGVTYKNRAKNGKSYESCGNYDHKKTLICYKGTLYLTLTGNDGKPDFTTAEEAKKYNYKSCNLHKYECDTSVYTLTSGQILNDRNDGPQNGGSREAADRGILTGNRGLYEACIDFTAVPGDPAINGEQCNTGTYRYKFLGCREGYILGDDGICKKDCSLIDKDGNLKTYRNNEEVIGYQVTSTQCPDECTGSKLVCNDGDWHIGSKTGSLATGAWYNYCNGGKKTCDNNVYNVNQAEHDTGVSTSFYADCINYSVNNNDCNTGATVYKLTGCIENHHTENMKWCVSNTGYAQCYKRNSPANSDYVIEDVEITWEGEWNEGHWSTPRDCRWVCKDGYTTGSDGKSCVLAECGEELNTCKNGVNATGAGSDDSASWWKCGSKTCSLCKDGYHPVGSGDTYPYCKENENGMCGPTPENPEHYQCILGDPTGTRDETFIGAGWSWICQGIGSGTSSENCHQCKLHAEWKNERCECEDGYHLEGYECVKNTYTCGEDVEHLYQCKDWNNEWISSTHTGYNAEGDYEWECGDVVCQLEKNVENIYICAEYLEDIPGTSPKNIKFMVVDDNSWPVNVGIGLDAQCSVDCSNGEGKIGGVYMYGIESGQKIGSYDRFLLTGYMGCTVNYDTCKDAFFSSLDPHFNVPSGYNVNYLGRCPKTFTYTICENSTESSSEYNGKYQEYTIPSVTHIDFYEKNGNKIPFRVEIKQPILIHDRNEIGIGSDGHYSFGNRNTYTCNSIYYIKTGDINSTSEQKPYCLNQYSVDGITSYMTIGGDPLIVPVAPPIGEDEYQFNVEVNCPTPPNGCSSYGNNLQPCPQSVVSQTQGATVYGNVGDYQCVKKGCCMKNSAILFGQCKT